MTYDVFKIFSDAVFADISLKVVAADLAETVPTWFEAVFMIKSNFAAFVKYDLPFAHICLHKDALVADANGQSVFSAKIKDLLTFFSIAL